MTRRSARIALIMVVVFVACMVPGVWLAVINGFFAEDVVGQVTLLLAFAGFLVVGAVIVTRRPGNAIGWVFSAIGLLVGTGLLAWQYAVYVHATGRGPSSAVIVGAWYTGWWWYATASLTFVFTLLLFPTGRLPSPRWRPVALVAACATATMVIAGAFTPTVTLAGQIRVRNPLGLAGIPNPEEGLLGEVLITLLLASTGAAALSMLLRFRRSNGAERQQLKWFTFAGAVMFLVSVVSEYLVSNSAVVSALSGVTVVLLPVSAGIAILRYRLYDIDRIINRTLVYGLVTALLGLVYAALVLLLGQVFGEVSGDPPNWVVAGATLAVAALFQPARRRVQTIIDRRFDRRRYDAARTVEAFTARMRDEVDLDTLSADLVATVRRTVQPTQVSHWLRHRSAIVRTSPDV